MTAIVFFPYESFFIRFGSAQASVAYSTFTMGYEIKTVETDKTAFAVMHRDNNWSYHSVTKYDDQYGFCDRHCRIMLRVKSINVDEESFNGSVYLSEMVNYETNEKCYIIKWLNVLDYEKKNTQNERDTGDGLIDFEQSTPMKKITFSDNRTAYAAVMDHIDEKMTLVFNGQTYELD